MKSISLTGKNLELSDFEKVVFEKCPVRIGSRDKIDQSRRKLEFAAQKGETVYSLNTGFGPLSDTKVAASDLKKLQLNLIRSSACGVGEPLDEAAVRAMIFLRAASLARGFSGAKYETIQALVDLLNKSVLPVIPSQGSVGASGDLAPLSHLALVLVGEGRAKFKGKELSGREALRAAGLKPIILDTKEGLALINGTQFITGLGLIACIEAERLVHLASLCAAFSIDVLRGTSAAFDARIHAARPHRGQGIVAANLRKYLAGSKIATSHKDCGKVQDPYSLRCVPQVHGVSLDAVEWTKNILVTEMNSVTDNPLVFPDAILSGGNFHGQYPAMALDFLSIAIAEIANISERRTDKLMSPSFSGLPPFLVIDSGLNSGLMIAQYTAAALVSENKTLAHPACVDSIPTSIDKEDHVSMGAWGARKARSIVANTRKVLAIELYCAAQGLEFLRPLRSSDILEACHKIIRKKVSKIVEDRVLSPDVNAIEELISSGAFDSLCH